MGMPAAKMKLKTRAGALFLNKDTSSLAAYNLAPPVCSVEIGVKERGRKK